MREGEQPVLIAGMHRSGTSALAGMMRSLGVWFGPDENLLPPAPDNPLGFFEHREIVALNVELLRTLGRTSDDPHLPFPPVWHTQSSLSQLIERACSILLRDLCGRPVWAWKDPRNCLTLSFWLHLVPNAKVILIYRDPLEVAASLQRRGRYTLEWGLYLWAAYHWSFVTSLRASVSPCVVSYHDLLHAPKETTWRVLQFIGGFSLGVEDAPRDCFSIRTSLYRNRRRELSWPRTISPLRFRIAVMVLRATAATGGSRMVRLLPRVLNPWALVPPAGINRFCS